MKIAKKKRPQILLDAIGSTLENDGILGDIVTLGNERDWSFINLRHTRGVILEGIDYDGAIIGSLSDSPLGKQLQELNCPTVRIGQDINPEDHLFPAILPDLETTGKLAGEHFKERNFSRVGYFRHVSRGVGRAMLESFEEHAKELGMTCEKLVLAPHPGKGALFEERRSYIDNQLEDWLQSVPKPIGILCYNDSVAARISLMCRQLGLAVPETIALLGYGNTIDCELSPVHLSSVAPNTSRFAQLAVDSLEMLMVGKEVPSRTFVPPTGIVERHSSNVLAVPDPTIARAIRYLWDHLELPITVEDVVRDMNVSRSTLERGFRKCLGRGIKVELQRKRLEQFTELLLMSDMTIPEIAERTGFTNLGHLHKLFKKQHGMTPRQYRVKNGRL